LIIIVIRHETTAAARWALLLFVRTLFNDAITVALWTGFSPVPPWISSSIKKAGRRFTGRHVLIQSRHDHPH
jgi:hypothetical protein